jgi:hypothetical protein
LASAQTLLATAIVVTSLLMMLAQKQSPGVPPRDSALPAPTLQTLLMTVHLLNTDLLPWPRNVSAEPLTT